MPWIILVDQGNDSGTPITNSAHWLIPRVCIKFYIDIFGVRVFEVYPYKKNPSFAEIDVKGIFLNKKIPRVNIDWKSCDENTLSSLKKILRLAGDGVIDHDEGIVVGPELA